MRAEDTLLFSEAASASAIVASGLRSNAGLVRDLGNRLRASPPDAVLTCARGSSDHAATFARYLFETRLGLLTSSQSPSVASVYAASQRTGRALSIAISQSGRSPDILSAFQASREAGALGVALVNVEDSPLAAMADAVLPLRVGPELSVAATKSYIAALATILQLVAEWSQDEALSDALLASPEQLGRAWNADWSPLVEGLADARSLFVVGRGHGLGIAQEAALKFKETCGIHAEAFSAAEIRHGPLALAGPDFPILVFHQSDEAGASVEALAADAIGRGAKVFIAGTAVRGAICLPSESAHAAVEPLLHIQSFYRAVNALAVRRGMNPDSPPHLRKVTETV
jgi:glucosamine--fructose-6-phosphate aminotransferase (isomerizing)